MQNDIAVRHNWSIEQIYKWTGDKSLVVSEQNPYTLTPHKNS